MKKSYLVVKWDTLQYLKQTRLRRNFQMGITSKNKNSISTSLWKGEKPVGHMNIYITPNYNRKIIVAEFAGNINKNYRGKGIGTWYRALLTKALFNSGVDRINHVGANMENLVAKELAKKEGISLLNAQKLINLIPLSTRIVRKLGYTPLKNKNGRNTGSSVMKSTNNKKKLNNVLRRNH
jgi:GNAT superfamily N-acetyltransferase